MILYFSGAGNSRNAAEIIARKTGDTVTAIENFLSADNQDISDGADFALVCAVHFFGLPNIVEQTLRQINFRKRPRYVYTVLTYGTVTGAASYRLRQLLRAKGIDTDAQFAIRMVDTWTPMFNLSDTNVTLNKTLKAQSAITEIADAVVQRVQGNFDRRRLPSLIGKIYYSGYDSRRRTKHFGAISKRCNGCGMCANKCPVGAIAMSENGLPLWIKERCTLCLRCLHNCPRFAIQYGNRTQHHGQFVNRL